MDLKKIVHEGKKGANRPSKMEAGRRTSFLERPEPGVRQTSHPQAPTGEVKNSRKKPKGGGERRDPE